MMHKLVNLFILTLLIASCGDGTKTPPKAEIYEVKNIGLLSTSEYTIGKIIKLDDPPEWYKFGDRKLLISCKAKIKAGVDLKKLRDGDILVSGNTLTILLPPAEITTFVMEPNLIHTEMESVSGFRQSFSQEEKNDFMRQGEKSIKKDIKDTKILRDAEESAAVFLRDFYKQMGYNNVIVKHRKVRAE